MVKISDLLKSLRERQFPRAHGDSRLDAIDRERAVAADVIEAQAREIEDLRGFIKGSANNMLKVLK